MRRFFLQSFLFLLPLLLVYLVIIFKLYSANEFVSGRQIIDRVAAGQNNLLIGRVYVAFGLDLELEIFKALQPRVTTLGNSRALQFRREFFQDEVSFYNLALSGNVFAYRDFLRSIPVGAEPELIIVALEQSFFNPHTDVEINQVFASEGTSQIDYLSVAVESFRGFIQGKFRSKVPADARVSKCYEPIGLDAVLNSNGFRSDGSHRYGAIISYPNHPDNEDFAFRNSLERVEKGINLFVQGDKIDETRIKELESFLAEAEQRGIHIVAFLPPYAPTVYQKMISLGEGYSYLPKLNQRLNELFKKTGHRYFNFSDLAKWGSGDQEFIDGVHGSEKAYLRIFIAMAERDPRLRALVDIRKLKKDLIQTESNLEVYGCHRS